MNTPKHTAGERLLISKKPNGKRPQGQSINKTRISFTKLIRLKRATEKAERRYCLAEDSYKKALSQSEHLSNKVFSMGRKKYYVVIEKGALFPSLTKLHLNEIAD